MASPEDDDDLIPDSGAVFTFGRSRFADNLANKFWIKNDPVIQVACGDEHSAVVTERGRVYVFGSNDWGQLGLGHKKASTKPSFLKVLKPEKIIRVACGRTHTLAYVESEKLYSFGGNEDGQLGHDTKQNEVTPKPVEALQSTPLKQISCGAYHSVALTEDGQVYVWGNNSEGQLGLGQDEDESTIPTKLLFDDDDEIISISCGYYHTACVSRDGLVYTFGEDETGKLGLEGSQLNDTTRPQPVATLDNDNYIQVSCGARHTVAITKQGRCYSWGDGSHGQLGHGTLCQEASTPKLIEALMGHKIVKVSCGDSHTAVLTDHYKIFTFGDGRHGKLGQGDECFSNLFKPTYITRFKGFQVNSVSCGGCHMLVRAVRSSTDNEEDEDDESLMSSMRSDFSLKEANMTLKPGSTFPSVSPRDKRRRKESDSLSKSLNLNGSLNNSLNMAQLNKRDLPQLPSSLDKNRLPKIPGMELGKKTLEPMEKPSKRNFDTGEPIKDDVNMKKNKRLVAEISFSRKPEPKTRPIPSPRRKLDTSEDIMKKLDINENLLSGEEEKNKSEEESEKTKNIVDSKNRKNLKDISKRTKNMKSEDNDSTESQDDDDDDDDNKRAPKVTKNISKSKKVLHKENDSEDDSFDDDESMKYKNKSKNNDIKALKKLYEEEEDDEDDEDTEEEEIVKKKKGKPIPVSRQVLVKHEEEESEEETEEEEDEDEIEEEESEEDEESEEEIPVKKSKKKGKEKDNKKKDKASIQKKNKSKYKNEDEDEDDEEDEEDEEEDVTEDEEDETYGKKKKSNKSQKKKIIDDKKKKGKDKKRKDADNEDEEEDEEEDDDEEDEEDEDEVDGKKGKKKKKGKQQKKVKKGKHQNDDEDEEEDEEEDDEDDEDETDGKKGKKKKTKDKKKKKKKNADDDEENYDDEEEEEEEEEEDDNDVDKKSENKEGEQKPGFFSFLRRNKKPQPSKEDNTDSGSKSTSPVPDQQKSKTCTIL